MSCKFRYCSGKQNHKYCEFNDWWYFKATDGFGHTYDEHYGPMSNNPICVSCADDIWCDNWTCISSPPPGMVIPDFFIDYYKTFRSDGLELDEEEYDNIMKERWTQFKKRWKSSGYFRRAGLLTYG